MKALIPSRGAMLAALFIFLSSRGALACAACYGDTSGSAQSNAAAWGIGAMVVIVFGMLGAIVGVAFHLNYRAKHPLPDYQELLSGENGQPEPKPGTSSNPMTFALLMEALGIAPNASQHGYTIDSMLEMLHWFMLVLFVGWGSFYAYTLWRFQEKKSPRANYVGTTSHLPTKLEGGVLVLEVVLLMAFAAPIWAARVDQFPTGADVTHIRAVGQQFQWDFQYAGPDGKLGERKAELVTPSNALGLDHNDPASADDITPVNVIKLPVNRPCIVDVMSKDVIHDFCIPNMRVAQDAIPGSIIPLWFIPIKTGTYEIVCAQLCGPNHFAMRGELEVVSEADYKKWYDEGMKALKPKPAEAPATVPAPAASH